MRRRLDRSLDAHVKSVVWAEIGTRALVLQTSVMSLVVAVLNLMLASQGTCCDLSVCLVQEVFQKMT